MSKLTFDIAISLDGYLAGPDPRSDEPLGTGGEAIHQWMFDLQSWQESHGGSGGEVNEDSRVLDESVANVGAYVMGRNMFGGEGDWGDGSWHGWWGEEPPYHVPVYVLTHHEREPLELIGTTFTFVTDGSESALAQAREAAGDKDVRIAGGADVVKQYLAAGLVDEFQVHVAPLFLGGGVSLFGDLGTQLPEVEQTRVIESPKVTHLSYRVLNRPST